MHTTCCVWAVAPRPAALGHCWCHRSRPVHHEYRRCVATALGASVAQLAPDVKNGVSHRAQAAAGMVAMLRQAWRLGEPGRMG